jgi:hypothetical protein
MIFIRVAGLDYASSFGPAFWISFSLHVAAAELWLRTFPNPHQLAHESPDSTSSPHQAAAAESCRIGQRGDKARIAVTVREMMVNASSVQLLRPPPGSVAPCMRGDPW